MSGTGASYPEPIERLIREFAKLPGVGRRGAERMAFHILKADADDATGLARAIDEVKRNVRPCLICFNLSHESPCSICSDPRRDASTVLVVEQTKDLITIEETAAYRGVYHVLNGRIDSLAGVEPESLTAEGLLARVERPELNARQQQISEVILGLNPDLEGDSTALYLIDQLAGRNVKVSRLARGLAAGSQLEYANRAVLTDAIEGRRDIG